MILVKMRPEQLQGAVKRNVPVIMPAAPFAYRYRFSYSKYGL
jgi:hypothetical protein